VAGPGLLSTTPGAPHVLVAGSVNSLARIVAQRLVDALAFRLKDEWVSAAHVAMSGGVLTEAVIESVADSLAKHRVDWDKVHIWWTDERYLPDGSGARFDTRARSAGLARIGIPAERIHPVPGPARPEDESPDEAAREYGALLRKYAPHGRQAPMFDLVLLEVAGDGAVASLEPGRAVLRSSDSVVPIFDAEPPAPLRVAMSLSTLAGSARVWLLGMGADRADAVRRALVAGPDAASLPAARARGILETLWWLDQHAARYVPRGDATTLADADADADGDGG